MTKSVTLLLRDEQFAKIDKLKRHQSLSDYIRDSIYMWTKPRIVFRAEDNRVIVGVFVGPQEVACIMATTELKPHLIISGFLSDNCSWNQGYDPQGYDSMAIEYLFSYAQTSGFDVVHVDTHDLYCSPANSVSSVREQNFWRRHGFVPESNPTPKRGLKRRIERKIIETLFPRVTDFDFEFTSRRMSRLVEFEHKCPCDYNGFADATENTLMEPKQDD